MAVVAGLSKTGGGTSYSVPAWSNTMAREQFQRFLVTLKSPGEELCEFVDENIVHLEVVPTTKLGGFNLLWPMGFAQTLQRLCLANHIHLIHNHGIWLPANHIAAKVARKRKIPYIVTPHGMLTHWSFNHKKIKKTIAWRLYQKRDLEQAKVVHVTSESEGNELRELGFRGPLAIIPNGIDMPVSPLQPKKGKQQRTALFISRIHPKKGLLNLVEAWSRIKPKDWKMVIRGPEEEGHAAQVKQLVHSKGLDEEFTIQGPVYGGELDLLFREADFFVLPTFSENFGIVVPQALSYGIPVITTQGAPWKELEEKSCGWWIPIGVEPLEKALRNAFSLNDQERSEMGARGRQLVEDKYTWKSSGVKMKSLYEWVLDLGSKPDFVETVL